MTLKIYGIPTCHTCTKALKWLDAQGVDYEFINTQKHPPTQAMITGWLKTLGSKSMRNTSGKSYRAMGEEKKTWSDQQWIEAFSADAMLLKRPLLVLDGEAVWVGFRETDEAIAAALGLNP